MSSAATSTFAELGVSAAVVERLEEVGITEAFPIQAATIEATLSGRDICGRAPTGSGKTLAFGLPVIDLAGEGTRWRPRALILAPTRELASQIKDELEPLAKARKRSILTVFGGTNIERDIRRLEKGVDILVACPGRLEDLISRKCCELRNVDIVVVDEADRMADMGFLPAVKRLLDQTAPDRHTLLFSATLDGDVNTLIQRYQSDPLRFEVEEQVDETGDVEHSWYLIQPADRIGSAVAVLRGYYSSIVFCRTRRGCDRVAKMFTKRGLDAVAIHGDRSQGQRERALKDFTSGKAQVLVATDVAARGIHVDNVALVMHYDPAGSDKDYIHRSGRTGRAGQDGRVISMVVEDKKKVARQLQKELGMKPGFDELDLEALPPALDRPKPKPEPEPERAKADGRRERAGSKGERRGEHNSKQGRNKSRGGADRYERDNRNDRDGTSRGRDQDRRKRRPPRRSGSNDWYPPGYHDDDKDRGERSGRDGRGDKRSAGSKKRSSPPRGRAKPQRSDKAGSQKSRPPKSRSQKSGPRKSDPRQRDSDDERDGQPGGGSGTTKRKSRANKGRHADKTRSKNKGKRRGPRSR